MIVPVMHVRRVRVIVLVGGVLVHVAVAPCDRRDVDVIMVPVLVLVFVFVMERLVSVPVAVALRGVGQDSGEECGGSEPGGTGAAVAQEQRQGGTADRGPAAGRRRTALRRPT